MSKRNIIFLSFFLISKLCLSQEAVDLGEILVTPYLSVKQDTYSFSYPIKVFTKEDINNAGVSTLVEFLKKTSLINVSDWYGNGVKANVDLMGFGDNALSNILILIDGRRMNDIDLSGVDWTQIPLDNIQKIEVIKGGGIVLYGDNSCGGIINIITRKHSQDITEGEVKIEGGSYSKTKETLYIKGGKENFSFSIYNGYTSTNGYRENSHYRSKYINLNINYKINSNFRLVWEGSHHAYHYGLAGALYESDLNSGYSRRDSKYPNDNAELDDDYVAFSFIGNIFRNVKSILKISYREKDGADNWLSYGGWNSIVDKHITNFIVTPSIILFLNTLNLFHKIVVGLDILSADFSADTDDLSVFDMDNYTDIDRNYQSLFINDVISLNDKVTVNLGVRVQKENFTFDYSSSSMSIDEQIHFKEESYETGVSYQLNQSSNLFINLARAFRIPKTDEYFSSFSVPPVNKDLLPQHSKIIVGGINYTLNNKARINLDVFFMEINNEIYYNPLSYTNDNYNKTQHEGFNINMSLPLYYNTYLSVGYRFTKAKFKKGKFDGKNIPAVPRSKLIFSIKYHFLKHFSLFIDTSYRSKVYLINDLNNSLSKLDNFWITNIRINFVKKNIEFYLGINNVFNEKYSEYAATNSTGTVIALYPSPERNYFWGVKLSL